MITIAKTILVTVVLLLLAVPVMADETTMDLASNALVKLIDFQQKDAVDNELELKSIDFERFAKSKVQQLNRNHKFSRDRMEITRKPDGTYRARYHQIDDSTLKVKVRRSQSNAIPYVGVASYREQIFESSASTPEGFDSSMFAVVEIIPNRHIFSYRKDHWD